MKFIRVLFRSMAQDIHVARIHARTRMLGVVLISITACLVACVSTPRSVDIGLMDMVLSRHGVGNVWDDRHGNQFVEMNDNNGNSYFVSPSGDVMCCYQKSIVLEGLFIHLGDTVLSPPHAAEAISTVLPQANVDPGIDTHPQQLNYLDAGFAHIEDGEYEQALDSFAQAISIQEEASQAHFGSGQAYFHLGNYAKAVMALEQAIFLDPALDQAYYFHSLSSLRLMSPAMDLHYYLDGTLSDSSVVNWESNRSALDVFLHPGAIAELNVDDYREVLLHLNIVIGEVPGDAKLYVARSIIHAVLKDYELAIDDLDLAVRLDPGLGLAYFKRSLVYYAVEMLDESLTDYVTSTDLNPLLHDVQFERMLLDRFNDDVLNSKLGDEAAILRRANGYRALQSSTLALADYATAIEINPVNEWAYLERARLYISLGEIDTAIKDLDHSIEISPSIPEAYSLRAEAFLILSRKAPDDTQRSDWVQLVIGDYAQALLLDPTNANLYLARGDARSDAGRFELALADYSRALNYDSESSWAYFQRGKLYYDMAQQRVRVINLERALEDYTAALVIDPGTVEYLIARARVYVGLGEEAMAFDDLFTALDVSPDKADVLLTIGETYHNIGEFNLAVEYFTHVIELEPHNDTMFYRRARSHRSLDNLDAALADFSRASELSPAKLLYYIEPANLSIELGRHNDAVAYLTKAIELSDEDPQLYFLRANEFEILGNHRLADDDYAQAIRLDPRNIELVYRRALALLAVGDFEASLNVIRVGLQISTDDPRFLVASGHANLGLGLTEAALAAYNNALSHASSELIGATSSVNDHSDSFWTGTSRTLADVRSINSEIHLGRARALVDSGQVEDGLQAFDQAIALVPDNPELYWHRAAARVEASCAASEESSLDVVTVLPDVRGESVDVSLEFVFPTNLRSGPGEEYPVVASESLGFNADMTGRSESGDWYEVSYGPAGYGLWVYSSGVLVTGDVDSVSVVPHPFSLQHQSQEHTASGSDCQFHPESYQDLSAAIADYTTAINLSSTTRYAIDRAHAYEALGQYEQAIEDVALAVSDGVSGWSLVQLERARQIQEVHLESDELTSSAFGVYVVILTGMGEDTIALGAINTAIELDSSNAELYRARADLFSRSGDLESAVDDYAAASDLLPTDAGLKQLHANALIQFANELHEDPASQRKSEVLYRLAIDNFNDLIETHTDNAELYVKRADLYASLGSYELALQDYTIALDMDTTVADWYLGRATVWKALHEPNLAFSDYKQAIAISPSDSFLHFERGNLHASQGNHVLALEDISRAISLDKSEPAYLETRADYYSFANNPQGAMNDLTKAIELSSDNTELYAKRANSWRSLGHFRQSVSDYNIVLDTGGSNPDHYFGRAVAYIELQDFVLALDDLRKAISIDPNMHEYFSNRASVLMEIHGLGPPIADEFLDDQSGVEGQESVTSEMSPPDEITLLEVQGRSVGALLEITLPINIRSGPGEEYPIVASETVGFTADLTGQSASGDWFEILYGPAGYGLWVHSSGVVVTGNIDSVPVASDTFSFEPEESENDASNATGAGSVVSGSDLTEELDYDTILEQSAADYGAAIDLLETTIINQSQQPDGDATTELLLLTKAEYHAGRAKVWQSLSEPLMIFVDSDGGSNFMIDELWRARADYDAAIAIAEDNAQYFARRSEINLQLGMSEAALVDYLKAVELDPLVPNELESPVVTGWEFRAPLRSGG